MSGAGIPNSMRQERSPLPTAQRDRSSAATGVATTLPLVSVVILTRGRPQHARQVLASVVAQDYTRREIILVDNESRGELREVGKSHEGEVVVVELGENAGACGGRNAGIRRAKGEIIVTLDDDVVFKTPHELSEAVRILSERPDTDVLAFQVCNPQTGKVSIRDWCHPRPYWDYAEKEFETYFFIEGAVAYRRRAFDLAGLYDERLFICAEGHDLAVRMIDLGLGVSYSPRVGVWHSHAPQARAPERPYYFQTRNYVWIAFKDYPWPDNLFFLTPKLLMMVYFAVRARRLGTVFRGLRDGFHRLPEVWNCRQPVSRETVRYLARLDKLRPGLYRRFLRHRKAPQL